MRPGAMEATYLVGLREDPVAKQLKQNKLK
jgi:hypothetical protein